MSASVDLPLHHKVQKFSYGTGSPGWSRRKGPKKVVVVAFTLCPPAHLKSLTFWRYTNQIIIIIIMPNSFVSPIVETRIGSLSTLSLPVKSGISLPSQWTVRGESGLNAFTITAAAASQCFQH